LQEGQLRAHGVYYYPHGLLRHTDTEGVVALIAPRPFLALTGRLDVGSPAEGIEIIACQAGSVYRTLNAAERFENVLYTDIGHTYTPAMRQAMLAWMHRWLQPTAK
jgi:hypothetical protein